MRGFVALVCALLVGVGYVSACSSFGTGAVDGADAAVCMPPACGGPSGRCGKVIACGLEFSCGECASPSTCVDGTCKCTGVTNVCEGATCGQVDNGCGDAGSCGSCTAPAESCQSKDGGGLACAPGVCIDDPPATTCKDKCHQATNNCGKVTPCGDCTNANAALCGADGKVTTCGCPARPRPLNQYTDGKGHFCYTVTNNDCPGAPFGTLARLYGPATEGLVPLYRCRNGLAYMLSTSTNCENVTGFTLEGPIGSCAATPLCGAVPLHRYYNPTTGDFVHGPVATPPPGYVAFGTPCYVWAP